MIKVCPKVSAEEKISHVKAGGIFIQVVGAPGMKRSFVVNQIQNISLRLPYASKIIKVLVEEKSELC